LQSLRDKLAAQENLAKNKQFLLDEYKAQYGDLNNTSSNLGKSGTKKVTFPAALASRSLSRSSCGVGGR
jgi:hypothetical protein